MNIGKLRKRETRGKRLPAARAFKLLAQIERIVLVYLQSR